MVKKQKRKKENDPPENMVCGKLLDVLLWVIRNVQKGVKRLRTVLGHSN